MLYNILRSMIATLLLIASGGVASAQQPMPLGMPQSVTLAAPEVSQIMSMSDMLQQPTGAPMTGSKSPRHSGGTEKPASMTNPSGILPLATGSQFAFEPLPKRGNGCNPRPIIHCTGPDFYGCTERIYYGTNPCDDDPVLSMSPPINDAVTTHWYQHAFKMVTRKKAIVEAIQQ